jgi:cytochrome c biogenesis protein CcdA
MATQWQKKQQRKQIPLKRLIIFIIGITCIAVGTTVGALIMQGSFQGHWTNILSVIISMIFPTLGLALSLLAWRFPDPPKVEEEANEVFAEVSDLPTSYDRLGFERILIPFII